MSNGDPKPVDKIADEIIKKDVEKQGEGGRPGKKGERTALSRIGVPAAVGLLVLAAGTVVYTRLQSGDEETSTPATSSVTLSGVPGEPVKIASDGEQPAAEPPVASKIDPCLVGTWVAEKVDLYKGFRVTFTAAGRQTIDYANAEPQKFSNGDTIVWAGVGTNIISTKDGVASIVTSFEGSVTWTLNSSGTGPVVLKLSTAMGLGGLGYATGDNKYVCLRAPKTVERGSEPSQGDLLEYQGSNRGDRVPDYAVRLRRVPPP